MQHTDDWLTVVDDIATLRPGTELDVATADRFRRALDAAVDAGCRELRVDLAGVELVDLICIAAVAAAGVRLRARGAEVVVVNLSPTARRAITLMGYGPVISVGEQPLSRT